MWERDSNKKCKALDGENCLIPVVVTAVTFALFNWEEIASIGMILFWAIIIMIIYNALILGLKTFESTNENKSV